MEIDDTYFGSPKPGKRGSGAEGNAKVVVAVEVCEDKPRFATMQQVESVSEDDISKAIDGRLEENITACTDEMFDRLLSACLNYRPIMFSELTA